jgi:hypothetical protein
LKLPAPPDTAADDVACGMTSPARARVEVGVPTIPRVVREAWATDRLWWCLASGFVLVTVLLQPWLPTVQVTLRSVWQGYGAALVLPVVTLAFVGPAALCIRRLRQPPESDALAAWRSRLTRLAAFLLLFSPFAASVSAWKAAIPEHVPFKWDAALVVLDRVLHGGTLPHDWLASISHPAALVAFDWIYGPLWIALAAVGPFAIAWSRPCELRTRFLVCYVLIWIVGGVALATLGSSAGPVYLDWLGLQESREYRDHLAMLAMVHAETPLRAVAMHATLLDWQEIGNAGRGISAFPSMHVATAAVLVFYACARWTRPLARMAAVTWLVLIQMGSVVLAWHYALDGYAGMMLAFVLWRASAHRSMQHTSSRG